MQLRRRILISIFFITIIILFVKAYTQIQIPILKKIRIYRRGFRDADYDPET